MEYVLREIADQFKDAFADKKVGFSAAEITGYFRKFSQLVKEFRHYSMKPSRPQLFIESLYCLQPRQQYYALNDLTMVVHDSKYEYPTNDQRAKLREILHNFISPNAIGLGFSRISEVSFRDDWIRAYRRLLNDPAGAITSARTLLESTLKTIIHERGGTPNASGDIGKLLKEAEQSLGFEIGSQNAEHQVFQGLASVVNGVASLSNRAGDRHGTIGSVSIDSEPIASLCVNSCGTLGLAFIEMHLMRPISLRSV